MAQQVNPATGRLFEPGDDGYSWDQPYEDRGGQLLQGARDTLQNGRDFLAPGKRDAELAAGDAYQQHPVGKPGFRGFTDYLDDAAVPMGLAGMANPIPMALAGLLAAPGGLRKMINPDEDESRAGGAVQAGVSALSVSPAFRGLKTAGSLAQEISPEVRAVMSRLAPEYGGVGANVEGLNGASSILPKSWQQFVKPANFAGKAEKAAPYVKPSRALSSKLAGKLQQGGSGLDEAAFTGEGRTLNDSKNPLLDLLAGGDEMTQAEYGPDLLANLSRLKIPARARAFATNTPIPE